MSRAHAPAVFTDTTGQPRMRTRLLPLPNTLHRSLGSGVFVSCVAGHQLSGLSLLGPMKSTPSMGMSFSLMAFCTQRWYFRKLSVHGSPLRSPFRNFSANQRLKHWSYSRFRSVHASPTLFMIHGDPAARRSGREKDSSAETATRKRHEPTGNVIGGFDGETR